MKKQNETSKTQGQINLLGEDGTAIGKRHPCNFLTISEKKPPLNRNQLLISSAESFRFSERFELIDAYLNTYRVMPYNRGIDIN